MGGTVLKIMSDISIRLYYRVFKTLFSLSLLLIIVSSCTPKDNELVVYTSVDRVYSEVIFEIFTEETGIKVLPVYDVEATKTTGLVQRLITEKDNPRCDVFWNGEILNTMKLKEEGVLKPYESVGGTKLTPNFIDEDFMWYAFGGRARVFIVNESIDLSEISFNMNSMSSHSQQYNVGLAKPMFGTTATHVASLYSVLGESEAFALMKSIDDSDVHIVDGNGAVRDMVVSGQLDFGLTDTDDALGAVRKGSKAQLVFPGQEENGLGTLVVPNSVGMIKGTKREELAAEFIEFLLKESTIEQLIDIGWFQLSMNEELLIHEELKPYLPDTGELKIMDVTFADIYNITKLSSKEMNDLFLD